MSSVLKRGCKQRKTVGSSAGITFDLHKYCDSIRHTLGLCPGIDVRKWSLKKEWVEFSKTFFVASRPKARYIRSSYDYFKQNENIIISVIEGK